MTDLQRLDVSLTKHGAHKIALLIEKFDKDEILNHLSRSQAGINIEKTQALKNLSAVKSKHSQIIEVPSIWNEARKRGSDTISALVLLSIIFSHYKLILAMQGSSSETPFKGLLVRGDFLNGKAFTNFSHTLQELGYAVEHKKHYVKYDLEKLFHIENFNKLFIELISLKLTAAKWEQKNSIEAEILANNFHEVFSISKPQFQSWLINGKLEEPDDLDFFTDASDEVSISEFVFSPGHTNRKEGLVKIAAAKSDLTAALLHNEIQNKLYLNLVEKYGAESVGTERATGYGTLIDVVVKTKKFCWFYEIKTASSVKACIRQAIPQLLEYAYWNGSAQIADKLIIVSPLPVTKEAQDYLLFLREKFGLPLEYEQFAVK
ncbi:Hypothetical protein mma_3160 [Janthinobacterium sp. Marseille]|nr:hypothetical protein [Janthinobacterium sp. Marseille]ABR91857.1 Hypothetical protein mma_3160 [Janthinobacterium sp. Marseille]